MLLDFVRVSIADLAIIESIPLPYVFKQIFPFQMFTISSKVLTEDIGPGVERTAMKKRATKVRNKLMSVIGRDVKARAPVGLSVAEREMRQQTK